MQLPAGFLFPSTGSENASKRCGWNHDPQKGKEEEHDEEFAIKLEALQEELEVLNSEAHELELNIGENVSKVLGVI